MHMSKDYKTTPLRICADVRGGADVDVSATLFVDDETTQTGSVTLPDVHLERQCSALEAQVNLQFGAASEPLVKPIK
jgi:hypothetical protein